MRMFFGFLTPLGAVLALSIASSPAQIFTPLHTFASSSVFAAPLVQGPDGTLYGTSSAGGLAGDGTIFKLQPDGNGFKVLYSFTNGVDGGGPVAGLVLSGNTLYGTARNAGSGAHGTVFKINTDGTGFVPIYSFTTNNSFGTNSDGAFPQSKLVLADGMLYGTTTQGGGHNDAGTVFKVSTNGTGFTVLYTFTGPIGGPGAYPLGGLVLDGTALYGTAEEGGTNFNGLVFTINTNGTGYTVLHTFASSLTGTNADGYHPVADLIVSSGVLYGTTMNGSPKGQGSIFRLNTDGSAFTNLYNFTNGVDGSSPQAALLLSGNTLYGTAKQGGGFPGVGTIFKLGTDGTAFTTMFQFASRGASAGSPVAGLIQSGDTLFGTAGGGIFSIKTNATNITTLSTGAEGAKPAGGVVLSGNTFYGSTSAGGGSGSGTIYRVNTNGTGFETLYTFTAAPSDLMGHFTNVDGASPCGSLILAGQRLYGTANSGGTFGNGTIFSINTNGTGFTNLYIFTNGADGENPAAGLVWGGGTLYGTTLSGGDNNVGTIFKINTDGSGYGVLYSFTAASLTNADGYHPQGTLVFTNGTLYGTAFSGGTNGSGTVFKINTNGSGYTVLYSFKAPVSQVDTTNVFGANPAGGLVLSGNTLYGTASAGGLPNGKGSTSGTIFKINTDGSGFTRLRAFSGIFDGASPMAAMVLSGNILYGTTSAGGHGSAGTVFQMDTDGNNFATIHTFKFQGGTPLGDLIVADGLIYGTSEFSVPGSGFVFSVTPTGPPTIPFTATPTSGVPPTTVQFNAPTVDDKGNTVFYWRWDFGDGATNISQNPSHTYSNNITYFPSLIATNENGIAVIGIGPSITLAYPDSILNGGFETGNFTNWTRTGNFSGSTTSTATQYKHSGTRGAQLTAAGSPGFLSQTLTTVPGRTYLISFWLDVPFNFTPNDFSVTWGGTVLMDQTNMPNIGWTNIQFLVTATGTSTTLQFGYRYDSAYFGLDDVSVVSPQPIISGFSFTGGNLVLTNTGGLSNRTYVVLSSTNVITPLNQWIPIATNLLGSNGNFSITATNAVSPGMSRQYYILQMR